MKILSILIPSILLLSLSAFSLSTYAADPVVKKSKSGVCHPKNGSYYSRTKHFTPYDSMEACLASGGSRPKR
jgi:hypothetical protein